MPTNPAAPAPAPVELDVPVPAAPAASLPTSPNIQRFRFANPKAKAAQRWLFSIAQALDTFIVRVISWLDNSILTPLRIFLFIAMALEAVALATLNPLIGILGIGVPLVLLAIVGIVYYLKRTYKERDPLKILEERYGCKDITVEGVNVRLVSSSIIEENGKKYFVAAYYEKPKEELRKELKEKTSKGKPKVVQPLSRYVVRIELTKTNEDILGRVSAADQAALQKLIDENKFLREAIVIPKEEKAPMPVRAWLYQYYIKPWFDFDWRNKSHAERFNFIKNYLLNPLFAVALNAAMGYWTIWSIAIFTGHLASTSALPFATPFIFFVPLTIGLLYIAAQVIISYRKTQILRNKEDGDSVAEAKKAENLVQILAKKTAAEGEAKRALDLVEEKISKAERTKAEDAVERAIQTAMTEAPSVTPATLGFWPRMYSFFFGGAGSQVPQRVFKVSKEGVHARTISTTVVSFAAGLITAFVAMWPFVDFLTVTAGFAVPPLYMAWLSIAAVVGIFYAVYAYRNSSEEENSLYNKLARYTQAGTAENSLYKQYCVLQRELNAVRAAIQAQRQRNVSLLAQRKRRGLPLPKAIEHPVAYAEIMGPDSSEFMEKLNIAPKKTWVQHLWLFIKQFGRRYDKGVGSAGSAVFLIRLVFILFFALSGFALVSELGVAAVGTYIGIGVFAALWSFTRFCLLLRERDQRFAEMYINESPAIVDILKDSIRLGYAQKALLEAEEGALNVPATPATSVVVGGAAAMAVASAALAAKALPAAVGDPSSSIASRLCSFFSFQALRRPASECAADAIAAGEGVGDGLAGSAAPLN